MIRKSLFWGLTLVLVVALVSLIIRGRQMEKQQSAKPAEVVQQSQSSPIRVLNPEELKVENPTMQLDSTQTATHQFDIRNSGSSSYGAIELEMAYLDHNGKILANRTAPVGRTIPPGATIRITDLKIKDVPALTKTARVSILSADLETGSRSGHQESIQNSVSMALVLP